MSSITTLTLFRFQNISSKIWAFGQMQFAHAHIKKTPGLQFYKLMGSGREPGFSPLPDWGVYAMLGIWDNEQCADCFFNDSEIYKRYQTHSSEQWTIFMKPKQAKGLWSGSNPFTTSTDLDEGNPLIAVITRATIKPVKLIKFWDFVPISQRPIVQGFKGLIYTKGIGEAPLVQMATFSLWENIDALKNFAYNSPEHQEAIRKTRKIDWYKEELFVRFQPYRSEGTWGGENVLATYLNP
jgi:heme-degrading monooxygenase HmoA